MADAHPTSRCFSVLLHGIFNPAIASVKLRWRGSAVSTPADFGDGRAPGWSLMELHELHPTLLRAPSRGVELQVLVLVALLLY